MNVLRHDATGVELRVSQEELVLINNALNEICNGVDIADFEFQTRLGSSRAVVRTLLDEVESAYRLAFDAEKGSRH